MKIKNKEKNQIMVAILLAVATGASCGAESLFRAGISEGVYTYQPRSLYNTIKARTVGDVITVLVSETTTATNEVKLDIKNKSDSEDNFTGILNTIFKTDKFKSLDGYGGSTNTSNAAKVERTGKLTDTITAQVVQVLPNGNLVIQGKKTAINSGERSEILLSGVVDPRFITNSGQVNSNYVANLQLAVVGKGTASSSDSESMVNKFMKMLF